jgi:hypothetical protein
MSDGGGGGVDMDMMGLEGFPQYLFLCTLHSSPALHNEGPCGFVMSGFQSTWFCFVLSLGFGSFHLWLGTGL